MSESQASIQAGSSGRWSGNLTKEDGTRVLVASLVASGQKVTLTNAATGAVVNSRSAQVMNAGSGFDFTETTEEDEGGTTVNVTKVGWHIAKEDTGIQVTSPDVDAESHVARMEIDYTDGALTKRIVHIHRLECVDTLGVCTYDDVAAALPGIEADRYRDLIEGWIRRLTRMIERRARRKLRKSATMTTEVFSPAPYETTLWLSRYPVDAVESVHQDIGSDFASVEADDATNYYVDAERGTIDARYSSWLAGRGTVRVTYRGGLYLETGACPEDLRWAAAEQVQFWWQNRSAVGATAVSLGGESTTMAFLPKGPLLPAMDEQIRLMTRARI